VRGGVGTAGAPHGAGTGGGGTAGAGIVDDPNMDPSAARGPRG